MPAYLPARRRSRVGAVVATALAALAGAGAVYLLLREGPRSASDPSHRPPLLGKDKTAAAQAILTEPVPSPIAPSSTSPAASPRPPSPPAPSPSPAAPSVAPAPPVSDAAPAGVRVYVRVAKVGGTQLELDGIVASPTDPVAMINRKLLGIGEGIEGWVVEKIEAKQVTLRGGRDTIVLRLR
jgi:hypothetical protein